MSVSRLLNRLNEQGRNLPEVVAPVLERDGAVRVIINRLPYDLRVEVPSPDWYILKPITTTTAEVVRTAEPFEIQKQLRLQPRLKVITIRRWKTNSWLVFPYNLSDARSRGLPAEPQVCHMINREIEPFMSLRVNAWGDHLLFNPGQPIQSFPEFLRAIEAQQEEIPQVKGVTPEQEIVYRILREEIARAKQLEAERLARARAEEIAIQARTVEGRIKAELEYLGAEYIGHTETGEGYTVSWRDGQRTYRSRVSRSMRLISAGICLDGLDREQTLASTVSVMRRSNTRFYDDYDEEDDW